MRVIVSAIFLISVGLLAACTPKISVVDRETGDVGTGTASGANFNSAGSMTINFENETYEGSWVVMRDAGAPLIFYGRLPADSGVGIANLKSNKGNLLRCEFGYSMQTLSGIGICKRKDDRTFDLHLAMG